MKIIRRILSLFFQTEDTERPSLTAEAREKLAAFWMLFPF